ncbi:MAG TPA: hypothetical protein VEL31_04740, partial [Ktedonobacteraceae bacterium]|nr:hypothetical protein [Ktedonobacteraceae bacterium]
CGCDYWWRDVCSEKRGSPCVLNVGAGRLARLPSKMPQFASRQGILADLYIQEFMRAEILCAGLVI